MAAISAANMLTLIDKWTAMYLGLATTPRTKAADAQALVIGLADADQIGELQKPANAVYDAVASGALIAQAAGSVLGGLDAVAKKAAISGVITLENFASYYNYGAGGPWNCLYPPDFRDLFYAAKGKYPIAQNVYFEVLQGGTYSNGLRKLIVGGAQTAGQDIDSTAYAGGVGQVKVSGYTDDNTGVGDTVTVAGTWRKPDGTLTTGNGTATVNNSGTFVLTPPASNYLLVKVSSISAGAHITAGTIYAEAKRPSGRTNPPS